MKIKTQIKKLFSNKSGRYIHYKLKQEKEILNWCNEYLKNHPEYEKPSYLIICICKNIILPKCKNNNCNNFLTYTQYLNKKQYCSRKCINYFEINQKIKNTCIKKYNKNNISQLSSIKNKKIQTSLIHYGVKYPVQSKIVKNKIKNTLLKNYNVEHPSQNNEIKEKIKQTIFNKYGVSSHNKLENIKKKKIQTCLKNFGVKYGILSNKSKQKLKEKRFLNTFKNLSRFKNFIIPQFTENEYQRM